jgi:hypothetical protein
MAHLPGIAKMEAIGKRKWAIAEGYIPTYGTGKELEFTSHGTACILNTNNEPAEIKIYIYFADTNFKALSTFL